MIFRRTLVAAALAASVALPFKVHGMGTTTRSASAHASASLTGSFIGFVDDGCKHLSLPAGNHNPPTGPNDPRLTPCNGRDHLEALWRGPMSGVQRQLLQQTLLSFPDDVTVADATSRMEQALANAQ